MELSKQLSKTCATARVYALISIISAHISLPDTFAGDLFKRIASVGVITFMLLSGYFYNQSKYNTFFAMLKNKLVSVCIPWFALGTVVFAYDTVLGKKPFSVLAYIKYIFGNGTYLYYMTVLMLCFMLFFFASKIFSYVSIAVTVISLMLTAAGILTPIIEFLHITNYLNILNWVGFFAVGQLLRNIDSSVLYSFLKRYRVIFIVAYNLILAVLLLFKDFKTGYFTYFGFIYELLGAMAIFSVSTFDLTRFKFFLAVSNDSFSIYLVHIMFIALLNDFMSKWALTRILMPLGVIVTAMILFEIGKFIAEKIRLAALYRLLTGIRSKKYN